VSDRAVMAQLSALEIEFVVAGDEDHVATDPQEPTMR
jgi:hypothetical protein